MHRQIDRQTDGRTGGQTDGWKEFTTVKLPERGHQPDTSNEFK